MNIRPATPSDVPAMLRFICELADYEREPNAVVASEADLWRDGWGLQQDGMTPLEPMPPPRFRALVAEVPEGGGAPAPVGFALYFTSYSTWLGHHGIRLEDLYVTPRFRGKGVGRALLTRLAEIALEENCGRLEWDVLTWNAPAIAVYERLGAHIQEEWRIMRVSGDALRRLAGGK